MILRRLLGDSLARRAALGLYRQIVEQARQQEFYASLGVPDTPDGRFDMIALHAMLILRRLKRDRERAAEHAQALFDVMFADMDQNLREMGVGDMSIGKRIRSLAQAFYGRLAAYGVGLEQRDDGPLASALRRNLYRKTAPTEEVVAAMVRYVRREADRLDGCALDTLIEGDLGFGAPPAVAEGRDG